MINYSKWGQLLPSILLLGPLCGLLVTSGCATAPTDLPGESTVDSSDSATDIVSADTTPTEQYSETASSAVVIEQEVPTPEVELSYFGVPTPQVEYGVADLCEEIGNKLGSVSEEDCQNQNLLFTGGLSVLDRPLAIKEYPPLPSQEPLGRVLLIGGIHGDEYSSVSIVFKWMDILNEHHSGIFNWQFIPLSNPDGLLRDTSQRQNENGVDLNRNFPSADWDDLAESFWQERTGANERRYPGQNGASEPEVAWLVKQIQDFQPDVIISVHAPYHLVDYDGPPEAPEQLGDLHLNKLGVFPGSLGNYAGLDLDKPVVTIELPYAGIMPSEQQVLDMWTDLVAWLIRERTKER